MKIMIAKYRNVRLMIGLPVFLARIGLLANAWAIWSRDNNHRCLGDHRERAGRTIARCALLALAH
jgi:hypothetical protein